MNIKELVKGIENCECGKSHACPIDYVEIGHGATRILPEICKEYNNILLVSDKNTFKVCGADVKALLGDKVENSVVMEDNGDVVIPNEEKIAEIEGFITDKTDLIVGVGSGVINDLCKYVSHKHDLYYYIVATAPSMDGYASVGSALILEGMKITLNARPPKAIVADTAVLKDAPMDMIRAGYGDIVGKYSCLNDWKLSAFINNEYFCKTVYDLTYSCAKQVETLADGINNRDEETVGVLMEALVAVGIAMAYVGNSRPASGSEHHLSHYFEITCILEKKEYFAHGIDVAFSAIATAKLREDMLKGTPKKIAFNRAEWEENIRRVYHSSADGVIALQDKLGWYNNDDSAIVEGKWEEIKNILSEVPTEAEFRAMVERVGLKYSDFEKLYGKEKIADSILYAKDLKDRYTVLWLYYNYFRG
ncbi:MAG: sn-glycerol-1-phosphate dehydrogenase [Clostridia bacterium]|nr:sn-glycerol-1-phosphate dehydrogenase [Clostridia bacterium]